MFQDHSLVTIEIYGMLRSRRLKEYWVEYRPTNWLREGGKTIAKLETKCDANSAIQIITGFPKNELGEGVTIVVYNLDRTVEWVELNASSGD